MTLKYDKFKIYWAAATEKKLQIVSLERKIGFFSGHSCFWKVKLYYQSTANRLFSLPWNYPNKWTIPLSSLKINKNLIDSFPGLKLLHKLPNVNWAIIYSGLL